MRGPAPQGGAKCYDQKLVYTLPVRLIDLMAMAVVAVVVLLPKPSVDARPALVGEPLELDRVAELEDQLFRQPHDVATALALADSYLSLGRADWALALLGRFRGSTDPRIPLARATAYAERLEARAAVAESTAVEKLCAERDCGGVAIKARLIGEAMRALVDGQIDPAHDPVAAKQAVYKVLHPGKYLRP